MPPCASCQLGTDCQQGGTQGLKFQGVSDKLAGCLTGHAGLLEDCKDKLLEIPLLFQALITLDTVKLLHTSDCSQ